MNTRKFTKWLLLMVAFLLPVAAIALPTYSGFTPRSTGYVVTATDWNNEFGNLIAYVNNNLTATLNQSIPLGNFLVGNGTGLAPLTNAGAADNGKYLQLDNTQPQGMKWAASIAGVTQLTTKGDLLGYNTGLTRIPAGIDGYALMADSTNVNGVSYQPLVPTGMIALWSGSVATIPTGWKLCDGVQNSPGPNLQGLFVVGAGGPNGAASGGMGTLAPGGPSGDTAATNGTGAAHTHSVSSITLHYTTGSTNLILAQPNTGNRVGNTVTTPRYYALAYIQKM